MATEYAANRGGMDGFTADPDRWSRQSAGLYEGTLATHTTGAQVRSGVMAANGTPLAYVATTGLSATLKAGTYLLAVTDAGIGPIPVVVPSDQTFTHDTAHASQPRSDLIIVEVVDNGDNTSTKKVRILKGTAGSGAPDPTLPSALGNGAVATLARVSIPAAATTLSTITDLRAYTAAAGGVVTVPGAFSTPSLLSALPDGTPVWDSTSQSFGYVKTAALQVVSGGAGWTTSGLSFVSPFVTGASPLSPLQYRVVGDRVELRGQAQKSTTGVMGVSDVVILPSAIRPPTTRRIGGAGISDLTGVVVSGAGGLAVNASTGYVSVVPGATSERAVSFDGVGWALT